MKLAILTACALATIASAAAKDAPHVLIPQAQWQKFRDQVILPGKCPDYFEPGEPLYYSSPDALVAALDKEIIEPAEARPRRQKRTVGGAIQRRVSPNYLSTRPQLRQLLRPLFLLDEGWLSGASRTAPSRPQVDSPSQ